MKKYFTYNYTLKICIIIFLFIDKAVAQYSIAGIQGQVYVDILPDTFLNPTPFPSGDEYYYMDINQDGNNDMVFHSHSAISSGHTDRNIFLQSLDTNLSFSFWKTDSVYYDTTICNPFQDTVPFSAKAKILKPYNFGDTIQNTTYVDSAYLTITYSSGFCTPPHSFSSGDWIDSIDHYIGIKYSDTSGIMYGWIKVNVTEVTKVLIKDFSLGAPSNSIIENSSPNTITVFPNPAKTFISLKSGYSEIKEITIYDVTGNQTIKTAQNIIDVSGFAEGFYFMEVKTSDGNAMKKIIIQR